MVGIFDCGGVLGKYEIRLKERKVVNMEALNTYKTEKTLAEQMNERLAEMKMTKAEAALKMNYSRAALSQYLNGKYASDPTELEKKVREFLAATGGVAEGQEPENSVPTGAGTLKKKVEFFESRDFVQTIGVCQACQEYMGLGIIVGKSGQGKTHALKKYAELPRVAYIECDDTMACRDLVEAIENGIGLPKGYGGTIWSRVNRIREFFNTNEGFLLIIDEADKLINKYTQKKMEILRGIFDQSNVGIVIAGEPRLETELKGNLARFANRMDFYYKLKGLSKNEVVDYLEGYEVDEAAILNFYYDYRKLDGMWKLDGSYMLDAEMTPVGTRIGYRYESLYELHEAGLAVMAYNYACRMVESAILKAAYSFRMYYFEYLKTDGSWITDGSHVVDAEMSPREMRWSTTFHHQHEEELLLKQRYRMQPCEEEYSIRKTLERYRMVIDYFDYLKLNGLWKLTGSRLMDAQRTEYTTKQAYSFGVEHTREFRVIWHEEHNLIFLDGTWSLDGSKIIDAWQKTEVL